MSVVRLRDGDVNHNSDGILLVMVLGENHISSKNCTIRFMADVNFSGNDIGWDGAIAKGVRTKKVRKRSTNIVVSIMDT
jgi:hypothetical protein